MIKELSAKQKQFGREFIIDHNVTAAYVRAGYAEKCAQSAGSRLMREPLMIAFIEELEAKAAERNDVDVDEVIKKLRESYDAATVAKHYSAAVRAAELLGKTIGQFVDVNKNIDVPDIPAEEAITDLCTQNGVIHETARSLFMQGLEALKTPYHPDDEVPTPPTPTQPAPRMVQ